MRRSALPRSGLPRALALLLLGLLTLTGCYEAELDLRIDPNDRVSGGLLVTFDEEWLAEHDVAPKELFSREVMAPDMPDVHTEQYDYGDTVGRELQFSSTSIHAFDLGTEGALVITREDDEYVVEGDFAERIGEIAADAESAPVVDVELSFPGDVIESDGTELGNDVTWELSEDNGYAFHARGSALEDEGDDEGTPSWLRQVIAVLAFLSTLGFVAALVNYLRKNG